MACPGGTASDKRSLELPGVQAEDHLGRLPPSQLALAGYWSASSFGPAGGQLAAGLADKAGRVVVGSFAG